MKIQDIINETTSAGIASVAAPMGVMSRRKKPKTLLASTDLAAERTKASQQAAERTKASRRADTATWQNWDINKLQEEMIKARKQGRLAWRAMNKELNRRIETGRLGKGGAVR